MTLTAGALIGFGVALARAGEERRPRRPRRPGELGLRRGESVSAGLRRMAIEQAELAIEELAAAQGGDAGRSVHEARKAIKRMRTIVRMQERRLGRDGCAREQEVLRAASSRLAGARDAAVLLATLDGLVERDPNKLAGSPGVTSLRLALAAERGRAERAALEPANLEQACEELRAFRRRASGWPQANGPGLGDAKKGLRRIYRRGRRRMRRAAASGDMQTMHGWRKRVKDLRYAAEALGPAPADAAAGRKGHRDGAASKRLSKVAHRADQLGELLGEEHDLAVLGEWIEAHGAGAGAGAGTRRRLRKAISRRRRRLRRRSLRAAGSLYGPKPKRFIRVAERACRGRWEEQR